MGADNRKYLNEWTSGPCPYRNHGSLIKSFCEMRSDLMNTCNVCKSLTSLIVNYKPASDIALVVEHMRNPGVNAGGVLDVWNLQ